MKEKGKEMKGITLIALVITIIVLLILASVSIAMLTGENGILTQANKAKELTGVAEEKEIIQLSILGLQSQNNGLKTFSNRELEEEIKSNTSNRPVVVTEEGPFIVTFNDTNREYIVDIDGTIEVSPDKVKDTNPGILEGNGEESNPYKIQSIEDLVQLSKDYNDGSVKDRACFELLEDLNFKSRNSYVDPDRTDFGDVNGDGRVDTLKVEMTTGKGFIPIGNYSNPFNGDINGNGHSISNLYLNDKDSYYVGFIGRAKEGITIENLNLNNVNITGNGDVAGIVAYIEYDSGTLSMNNCNVSGKITASTVGGLIGEIKSTGEGETFIVINNCHNSVDINSPRWKCWRNHWNHGYEQNKKINNQ